MSRLSIIVASTRPTRVGPAVARWFVSRVQAHGRFDEELVDLAEVGLPLFDEPEHPRLREYRHEHTRRWSAIVARADAFAFVLPEYNHASPPALVNALDYLVHEWAYKPAMLVSYGGVSGGTRSAVSTAQILAALKVVTIAEAIAIPFIGTQVANGEYGGSVEQDQAARVALDELVRWTAALRVLRAA